MPATRLASRYQGSAAAEHGWEVRLDPAAPMQPPVSDHARSSTSAQRGSFADRLDWWCVERALRNDHARDRPHEPWRVTDGRALFGEVLRSSRERLHMTQEELAQRAALCVRTIRDLEAGRVRKPRGHSVRQIADALLLDDDARLRFLSLAYDAAQPPSAEETSGWAVPDALAGAVGFVVPGQVLAKRAGVLDHDGGPELDGVGIGVVILACILPCSV
jgi:transcriptional regulator with XRE-family HTH domain